MSNRLCRVSLVVVALLCARGASAQSPAMDGIRTEWAAIKTAVMGAANKTPDTLYGFQPTPDVYTLRKMLLHIADASYSLCAGFQGTPGQRPKVNADSAAPKAEVLQTLTAAFAFCDTGFAAATDASLGESVALPNGQKRVKSYYAAHQLAHTNLHYGNVVTYMRLNKRSPGEQ